VYRLILCLLALLVLSLAGVSSAAAQSADPPTYQVQPGDTLSSIAVRFGLSTEALIRGNELPDPNHLKVGDLIVIPGLEEVHGLLTTQPLAFGDTLRHLTRRIQVSEDLLVRLNRITSPGELYAGTSLVIPQLDSETSLDGRASLTQGETLLELAVLNGSDPWSIREWNSLAGSWEALPGDILFFPLKEGAEPTGISPAIAGIRLDPLPLVQGHTVEIAVSTHQPVTLSGSALDHELHFFQKDDSTQVALLGVHALAKPGPYPFRIDATLPDGSQHSFEQLVLVESGNYLQDPRLIVDPATVDPKTTVPEMERVSQITKPVTPERYWSGAFQSPGYDPNWVTSYFGNRRMYNEDPTVYFHTGIDYGGGVGLPINAPAAGVVVFAEQLTVRGYATIIDHGWGVFSGFWHQSEIQVQVGERVQPGQQIGLVGGTGRVTGAHLHWEIWVNGVQVEPLDWLERVFP